MSYHDDRDFIPAEPDRAFWDRLDRGMHAVPPPPSSPTPVSGVRPPRVNYYADRHHRVYVLCGGCAASRGGLALQTAGLADDVCQDCAARA